MFDFNNILSDISERGEWRMLPSDFNNPSRDFSSNDYLGIASDKRLLSEFMSSLPEHFSFTSSASRLLSARQHSYSDLESYLSELYGSEALLFNSGYHLNTGVISSIGHIPSTLIIADKLSHASIIDGIILSRNKFVRFRHNDMEDLENILKNNCGTYRNLLVITESVFSMDGDESPLLQLVELKKKYPGMCLYVDEAHAFGVRGKLGLGLSEEKGVTEDIDFLCGTLGKAAASAGAFIICDKSSKDFLVNTCRSLIFSTVFPPVNAVWSLFIIQNIIRMDKERKHLAEISLSLKNGIELISGKENPSSSNIIPWILGSTDKVNYISGELRSAGIRALPIRRPTVPAGTERIRFSIGANHTHDDINSLLDIISNLT